MTKTEKKIQKRLMIGGFTSGAEMRRAIKMLKAIKRAREDMEARKVKEAV